MSIMQKTALSGMALLLICFWLSVCALLLHFAHFIT